MERLTKLTYIFSAVMAAVALIFFFVAPKEIKSGMNERKMEDLAPTSVGKFQMVSSVANPKQSYQMDERTYKLLTPYGIVARVYQGGNRSYDCVLIAGNSKENFHDPHVCFNAQGWDITKDQLDVVHTKTRGDIPVSVVQITGQGVSQFAVYFYRGFKGFYASTPTLGWALITEPLKGNLNTDAVFYRFMPSANNPGVTLEDLKQFVADYMDAAKPVSGGFF